MVPIYFIDNGLDEYAEQRGGHYCHNNKPVPRTTEILSAMLYDESLIAWSNFVGRVQRKDYKDVRNKAGNIGTYAHNLIEDYIQTGIIPSYDKIPFTMVDAVLNAFNGFRIWWDQLITDHKVEIISIEQRLTCEYFGGTLDLLISIDDKITLVDFKTSNKPSYKYFLQMASYRYMLKQQGVYLNACIILMLDKSTPKANYLKLNLDSRSDFTYMEQCEYTFMMLAQAYLQRLSIEDRFEAQFIV